MLVSSLTPPLSVQWLHARETTRTGSLMALDWSSDGTQFCGAGADGSVAFARLVDRQIEWRNFEITLNDQNQIVVQDVLNDSAVR